MPIKVFEWNKQLITYYYNKLIINFIIIVSYSIYFFLINTLGKYTLYPFVNMIKFNKIFWNWRKMFTWYEYVSLQSSCYGCNRASVVIYFNDNFSRHHTRNDNPWIFTSGDYHLVIEGSSHAEYRGNVLAKNIT